MALQGFQVHSPSTVILDDDRDPDVSWAHHESRYPGQSNRGGVDVVAPVGTPVHAWADGTVLHQPNNGSAGNVIRLALAHDPGWFLDYKHLSRYAVSHGTWVQRGALLGYSGTSGGVAPHVHYNLVDPGGVRRNPWHYIEGGTASAGQITPVQEDDMFSDQDRHALNLILESQGRVETHAWHIHSVIDQLRFAIIGNEPNQQLRLKLDQIQAELEKDYPKPSAS